MNAFFDLTDAFSPFVLPGTFVNLDSVRVLDTFSAAFRGNPGSFSLDNLVVNVNETAVPEPATLVLLGSGIVAAGMRRRRRRRLAPDRASGATEALHQETREQSRVFCFAVSNRGMLEARHLNKRFFGVTVVNDVSFEVRRGEVVGYLGPNGSGKSTTARMLHGASRILGRRRASSTATTSRAIRSTSDGASAMSQRSRFSTPSNPPLSIWNSSGRLRELEPATLARKIGALLELFGLSHAANQDIGSYLEGHETERDVDCRAAPQSRRPYPRRARFRPRRDDDAGAPAARDGARQARGKAVCTAPTCSNWSRRRATVCSSFTRDASSPTAQWSRSEDGQRRSSKKCSRSSCCATNPERTAADIADVVVDHA